MISKELLRKMIVTIYQMIVQVVEVIPISIPQEQPFKSKRSKPQLPIPLTAPLYKVEMPYREQQLSINQMLVDRR